MESTVHVLALPAARLDDLAAQLDLPGRGGFLLQLFHERGPFLLVIS